VRTGLPLLLLVALGAACHEGGGPRTLPYPELDPTGPFPELRGAARPAEGAGKAAGGSWVDRAVAEATGGGGTPAGAETAAGVGRQTVLLAGRLAAEIPEHFGEWRWASDGHATLVVHARPGSRPSAMVYAETFSGLIGAWPSVEHFRFRLTVDPGAPRVRTILNTLAAAVRAAQGPDGPSLTEVRQALEAGLTRTVGEGWAYHSVPGSFSGWRWVGKNAHGVAVRLARTDGAWGTPRPPVQSVLDRLASLAEEVPELAKLGDRVARLRGEGGRGRSTTEDWTGSVLGGRPAYLVLGSAALRDNLGVHLAVLCTTTPRCESAGALADLLDSLRPPGTTDPARPPPGHGAAALAELAWAAGLHLDPTPSVLGPADLEKLLRRGKPETADGAP